MTPQQFMEQIRVLAEFIDSSQIIGFSYTNGLPSSLHLTRAAHDQIRDQLELSLEMQPIGNDWRGKSEWNDIEIIFISLAKPLRVSHDCVIAGPEEAK
jgi:hypothetical protein